jgi:hypothetical protein
MTLEETLNPEYLDSLRAKWQAFRDEVFGLPEVREERLRTQRERQNMRNDEMRRGSIRQHLDRKHPGLPNEVAEAIVDVRHIQIKIENHLKGRT